MRRRLLHLLAPLLKKLRRRHHALPGVALRILFIRTDRIGDMALSTPALRALKDAFPGSHLAVLASRVNASLLDHNPHVDRVLAYPSNRNLRAKCRLARELRKEAYDIVIDPLDSYDLETALLTYSIGPGLAIGFEGSGREVFFDRVRPGNRCSRPFVDVSFDLLRLIGIDGGSRRPELFLTAAEIRRAEDWISDHVPGGRFRVGIHPGAHYETQKWGVRNYAGLIRSSCSDAEVDWVLIGGPEDAGTAEAIRSEAGGAPPLFIDGDLRRSMALISRLDALVCNNSGPLHIAAALNIPTVSFMGPTQNPLWAPSGRRHRVLRVDHLDCIGCNSGVCRTGTMACMRSISPDMAMDALGQLLGVCRGRAVA